MNPTLSETNNPDDAPEPPIPWEPDVTREEIDRRIRESKGTTLSDIWKRLGAGISPTE